ncbi:MAG: T9SS type A sorting domain-containing protein [Flavobacteriales bacterium]|nr:T9SS type A sorting domain-containing protein [Flavobacteriales bacterium]
MIKRISLLCGSIVAAVASLFGQISNFVEVAPADTPLDDITDDLHVHIEDLDGDGFDEVIMYSNDLSDLRLYSNDGTGAVTLEDPANNILTDPAFAGLLETGDLKRMEFADFDNDGDTDIAIFSQKYYNDGSLLFFANDGNQMYTQLADNLNLPSPITNGQFTDMDDDGDQDMVNSNFVYDEDTKLWSAYNQVASFDNATTIFDPFVAFPQITESDINFFDIDEDGDEDAFVIGATGIDWHEKTAASTFSTQVPSLVPQMSLAPSVFRLDVGDIDNDGALDMVLWDANAGQMRHYEQACADPPGTVCDDGDLCTSDDVLDADCNCIGIPLPDSDGDGICDDIDETNGDCELNAACDDGDVCTLDDVFDADCNCIGTPAPDSDNDGLCDEIDETNGDCTLGDPCDDGDDCTEADALDADCQCVGVFQDADNDTVCDAEDECPGFDDTIDNNNNGIPDCLEPNSVSEILASQFNIFPNPSNGLLNIETDLLIQEILILNSLGQVVKFDAWSGNKKLDLGEYSSGVYYLRVTTEQGMIRKKLILQK